MTTDHDLFSTETAGLAQVPGPQVVRLADGDRFGLSIGPVRKDLERRGPGWHGLGGRAADARLQRVDPRPDPARRSGVGDHRARCGTTVTWRRPCTGTACGWRTATTASRTRPRSRSRSAAASRYQVQFPDAGFYWYHPHMREDFAQEMGLYGTIVVEPADPAYWPAVDRQLTLTLDDLLVEDGHIAPFRRSGPNFTAMGRFGNVLLINGETEFSGTAARRRGRAPVSGQHREHADLQLRRCAAPGRSWSAATAAGTSGRRSSTRCCSRPRSGRSSTCCSTPRGGAARAPHPGPGLRPRRVHRRAGRQRAAAVRPRRSRRCAPTPNSPPSTGRSSTTSNGRRTRSSPSSRGCRCCTARTHAPASSYACPMHPEVTATEPATCPKCGMRLVAAAPSSYACPMHPEVTATEPSTCPQCGMKLVPSDAPAGPAARGPRARPRPRRRPGVGGPDAGDQPGIGSEQHDLAAHRPGDRRGERRHRLGVHRRRPGEDPAGQRDGLRPPDAPPVPHPRRRPLPRPVPGRRAGAEPGVEGHRAGAGRRDRGHPARRHATPGCGWRTATSPSTPRAA